MSDLPLREKEKLSSTGKQKLLRRLSRKMAVLVDAECPDVPEEVGLLSCRDFYRTKKNKAMVVRTNSCSQEGVFCGL